MKLLLIGAGNMGGAMLEGLHVKISRSLNVIFPDTRFYKNGIRHLKLYRNSTLDGYIVI